MKKALLSFAGNKKEVIISLYLVAMPNANNEKSILAKKILQNSQSSLTSYLKCNLHSGWKAKQLTLSLSILFFKQLGRAVCFTEGVNRGAVRVEASIAARSAKEGMQPCLDAFTQWPGCDMQRSGKL